MMTRIHYLCAVQRVIGGRLGLADLFLGGHAPDELPERRRPLGGPVERRRRRGRGRAVAAAGRHHLVRVGRRGRRRGDARVGRELPAAGAAAGALGRPAAHVFVFVFAGRRERVVDVRHEPGQRAAGHGPFGRRRRRVRERARRQPFREFGALQLDVRRGHPVGGTAELVQRETASDKPRRLVPAHQYSDNNNINWTCVAIIKLLILCLF